MKEDKRLGYVDLIVKSEDKIPPGRPRSRWENNSKIVICRITETYIILLNHFEGMC